MGMSDVDKTLDFRWTDGTIMMWSRWSNREPNHYRGYEPYGAIYPTRVLNDYPTSHSRKGLCEKSGKFTLYLKYTL